MLLTLKVLSVMHGFSSFFFIFVCNTIDNNQRFLKQEKENTKIVVLLPTCPRIITCLQRDGIFLSHLGSLLQLYKQI